MITWTFHSFSMERFLHYFGHSTAEEASRMIEVATWEEKDNGASVDMEQISRILKQVATTGLSYNGLSEPDAVILDRRLKVLFSPWGFEEELDLEHESPEPYAHVLEMEERVPKTIDLRFMPMLRFGWRYGTTEMDAEPEYFILHPEHVGALASEVSSAMANPEPWSDELFAELAEQNLVQVLKAVTSKGKGLAGVLAWG